MSVPIESDPDFDGEILEKAKAAFDRWRKRRPVRNKRSKAVDQKNIFEADTRSRLALRVNRLLNDVRLSAHNRRLPDNPALRSLIERSTPIVAEDLNPELVQEIVTGARDFLSIEFLERGLHAAKRVGRVLIQTGGAVRARGTAFMIGPGLAITNQHVLRSAQMGASCSIEMDYVQNRFGPAVLPQTFAFEPSRFFLNHKELDFAIVAVAPRSLQGISLDQYGWLPLNGAQGKIAIIPDDFLNIIQHPKGREKEVVIRENRLLDLATSQNDENEIGPFLHYEGDTEKGSSGSPVLNDQWEVVGLHHSGVPRVNDQGKWLTAKGEVWREGVHSVEEIAWVGNEGIRISSLLAELSRTPLDPERKQLLAPVLAAQASLTDAPVVQEAGDAAIRSAAAFNAVPSTRPLVPDRPQRSSLQSHRPAPSVTLELPLRLTLSIAGDAVPLLLPNPPAIARPVGERTLLQEALDPEDYADREGYDRRFLGVFVPFPTIKERTRFGKLLRVARPARPNDHHELRYHRFSILMNETRRLAYVSACNVNFDPPEAVSRDEGSQSWRRDPRIDVDQQVGGPYYEGNKYDKGHLTRRDDAAWGRDWDNALAANWDTFHYTNAAPQHELFNRSTDFTGADLDLWGDLENFISAQGTSQQRKRLSIFNGPIFRDDDKPYRDILVPRAYFKVVVWRDGNAQPGALGFVLEQENLIDDLAEEAIDAGRFHVRQRRIREIERQLDISFGVVTDWESTQREDGEEALEDDGIEINAFSDIVGARSDSMPFVGYTGPAAMAAFVTRQLNAAIQSQLRMSKTRLDIAAAARVRELVGRATAALTDQPGRIDEVRDALRRLIAAMTVEVVETKRGPPGHIHREAVDEALLRLSPIWPLC